MYVINVYVFTQIYIHTNVNNDVSYKWKNIEHVSEWFVFLSKSLFFLEGVGGLNDVNRLPGTAK